MPGWRVVTGTPTTAVVVLLLGLLAAGAAVILARVEILAADEIGMAEEGNNSPYLFPLIQGLFYNRDINRR